MDSISTAKTAGMSIVEDCRGFWRGEHGIHRQRGDPGKGRRLRCSIQYILYASQKQRPVSSDDFDVSDRPLPASYLYSRSEPLSPAQWEDQIMLAQYND